MPRKFIIMEHSHGKSAEGEYAEKYAFKVFEGGTLFTVPTSRQEFGNSNNAAAFSFYPGKSTSCRQE